MSDIDILNQMIQNSAKVVLDESYGKKIVKLIEPQTGDCCVSIYNIPNETIVIKVDTFKSPNSIFTSCKGECKRADFILITNTESKKVILFIEMKKKKASFDDIKKQLMGAICFFAYCKEIGRRFWSHNSFLEGYKHRFISIGHISIAKRKTRMTREYGLHDKPEKMMKVDWPHHLEFNHLAGG